jgi:pectin methylesterase-like acyl-CoA thioesterase
MSHFEFMKNIYLLLQFVFTTLNAYLLGKNGITFRFTRVQLVFTTLNAYLLGKNGITFRFTLLLLVFMTLNVYGYDATVAKDGSGNFTTVQAALDAAPTNRTTAYTIFIKNGIYKEKITVASNKTFITLIGESMANVVLTNDDYSGKLIPGGGGALYGTGTSASVTINANDFTAVNITFENTTGESPQAVAVNINGDRNAFKNCRFLGGQDTLLPQGAGKRQYFKQCYIDGTVDFIFGSAIAIFDDCTIYPKTRSSSGSSYITAANTPPGQTYGYVFRNCEIKMNRGSTTYVLGRPWQNDAATAVKTENKVVFLNTIMGGTVITAAGWSTWDAGTNTALITYAEYNSVTTTGTPVDVSARVAWSQQLTVIQAATYSNANVFGTWDPCTAYAGICTTDALQIAVANFKGVKGATTSAFTWNASFGISQVVYTVYRSIDNKVSYQQVYQTTSPDAIDVNFGTTDANPPAGSTYYYYLVASKAGLASQTTEIVAISSTPTTTVGAAGAFLQGLGLPSVAQFYTFSAVNLTGDVTITPPTNYQISMDGGTTWFFTPLSIAPVLSAIASRTIGVRLNSTTAGTFTGNIVHTSAGAASTSVAVTGVTQPDPLPVSITLLSFPMTATINDDATARATGVTTTTPTLSRLTTSTATSPASYSATLGQTLCPIGTTNGLWSLATANAGVSDGTGGNLTRTHYEQFTIAAATNYSVRVDSFILNSAFYNTSSGTKLAVVYSRSGFSADSTDVSGGILGGAATTLAAGANGTFAGPILLSNQTAGTTVNYRLALNGATGITLTAGQTLTIRIYMCCSSTGIPRYGMVKDVFIKGLTASTIPLSIIDFKVKKNTNQTHSILWTTADAVNVSRFVVERSADGLAFAIMGESKAHNGKNQENYALIDEKPLIDINYYRLRSIDNDGTGTFSKIVSINNAPNKSATLKLYPSVSQQFLTVETQTEGAATLQIRDVQGRIVMTKVLVNNDLGAIQVDVQGLGNGTYFLSVASNLGVVTEKFLKH